jgi:hypothetical protein
MYRQNEIKKLILFKQKKNSAAQESVPVRRAVF